tara:strand:+ start:241 stop:378 length:138 start_codon:yes stop_codon:yes gene_type:complete
MGRKINKIIKSKRTQKMKYLLWATIVVLAYIFIIPIGDNYEKNIL